ncbi:MAG: hypothetical protein N3C60_00520 [Calditerrivibrio sp.]|nr:hypothetical protein [Calditerrivibrio sp.]
MIGKISYVEKVQDVQDRSIDNKVVVVSAEFQKDADKKMETVEEAKKTEMIIIEEKRRQQEEEKRKKKGLKKDVKEKIDIPEEEEGKIIDIKG